jgi:hypothetical protein
MASKHRKRSQAAKRIATVGAATATVTVLTVGAAPPPTANAAATTATPGLPSMPLANGAPDPASIPDLTFGYGSEAYNEFQTLGIALETAIANNVDLSKLLGYDPQTTIVAALDSAITKALAGTPVDLSGVPILGPILTQAGITNAAALLKLLGFGLPGGTTPGGFSLITAGPPFTLLKLLGVDLGWTPGFPNSIADAVNANDNYDDINVLTLLQTLAATPGLSLANKAELKTLMLPFELDPSAAPSADIRVPIVVGFGLGAFAAGQAYPQIVADLANQPGGSAYTGTSPNLGSFTILPMILLRNPGRANGGLFARFYPEAALLGINTVTPDTEVSSSGTGTAIGTTGLTLGGANLIPIKVDGTVEYDPLSDVPAWPNPIALANSAAAFAFPTYILRGVTADSLTAVGGQASSQLGSALGADGPLALNLYLTVPVNDALPLLEPVKLPVDVINLFTGANLNNPVATALEPALTSLVNLGYTDVTRKVVNGVPEYDRTLDQAGVITPFGTLPSGVNWVQVPGDLIAQLAAGTETAIGQGVVSSTPVANPLATLANLLGINLPGAASDPSPLNGLTSLSGLTDNAVAAAAGAAVPTAPAAQPQAPQPNAAKVLADNDVTDTDTVVTDVSAKPEDAIKAATARTQASAKKAQARLDASAKKAGDRLDKIAKDGQKQIQKVAKHVADDVQKTVKAVTGAGKSAEKKDSAKSGSKSGD